jgi:hypothetical protein
MVATFSARGKHKVVLDLVTPTKPCVRARACACVCVCVCVCVWRWRWWGGGSVSATVVQPTTTTQPTLSDTLTIIGVDASSRPVEKDIALDHRLGRFSLDEERALLLVQADLA